MTQEEKKNILLRDLCARLPYEPIVEYAIKGPGGSINITCKLDTFHIEELLQDSEDLVEVKSYLRPMSSMTEEEKMKLSLSQIYAFTHYNEIAKIDWLNEHHFDYRDLIDKGLAIEVTEENNPYKN